jgi:transcriptional regulator with GAF, ATPase, and Fis domain
MRTQPAAPMSFKLHQNIEWIERETIRRALEASTLKREAARLLGISPRALAYYLAKYSFIDKSTSHPAEQSSATPIM